MFTNGNKEDEVSPPGMLTANEVAHLLHVHPNTIRLWSNIGVLKAYRIGKRRNYRFRLGDIETFLRRNSSGSE